MSGDGKVVDIARFAARRPDPTVWECSCESQHFYLLPDWQAECRSCHKVTDVRSSVWTSSEERK